MFRANNIIIKKIQSEAQLPVLCHISDSLEVFSSKLVDIAPQNIARIPIGVHFSAKTGTGLVISITLPLQHKYIGICACVADPDPKKEICLVLFNHNLYPVKIAAFTKVAYITTETRYSPFPEPVVKCYIGPQP